jgi:hypothetical protein
VGKKDLLEAPHRGQGRGKECRGALNEVEVELRSELNPVKVAIDIMLSSNNLSSKVVLGKEPMGIENILQVKD